MRPDGSSEVELPTAGRINPTPTMRAVAFSFIVRTRCADRRAFSEDPDNKRVRIYRKDSILFYHLSPQIANTSDVKNVRIYTKNRPSLVEDAQNFVRR